MFTLVCSKLLNAHGGLCEPVEEREPLASLALHVGTAFDVVRDVLEAQLFEQVRSLDEQCAGIPRAASQEHTLILAVTACQQVDEAHHPLVVDRGCELIPGDAALLDHVMKQRCDHHTVAAACDGARHPSGVFNVTTPEPRGETVEQLRGKPLSLSGRDHVVPIVNDQGWTLRTTSRASPPSWGSSSPEVHERAQKTDFCPTTPGNGRRPSQLAGSRAPLQ